MATRKALVLVSGQIQQLQSGDTLAGPVAETEYISLTNDDSSSHAIGDCVYIDAADGVKKAKADASGTAQAFGFATATIANAAVGSYQSSGILAGLSALTAGSAYYLSAATAGTMTTTAPSTVGQYVVRLGTAISTTELKINIQPPILL
jgi:hypothetical protein